MSSLSNGEVKEFCLSLLRADTTDSVTNILKKYDYLDKEDNWKPLGGTPANWSTVGNQSSESVPALVEKLVNCQDHVLIAECWIKDKVDPRSANAPNSMHQAVERYFNIPGGVLINLDKSKKAALAERIQLVATGEGNKDPCYTILDDGEGQSPDNFAKTLLSLPGGEKRTNKSGIKFVQGIFNMGGTGVLRFCKRPNYELIISRRNPKVPNASNLWGFTVIRRNEPDNIRESSVIEYLAPEGKILRFNADSIPALPGPFPLGYIRPLKHGTCVKLYEYEIRPKALTTNAILDLNYELSRYFHELALPIRIVERRKRFSGHTFETTLAGMSVRLNDDRSKVLEEGFPSSNVMHIREVGEIPVTIYAFKVDIDKNHWARDKPIILTVNGQMHGPIAKSFFSRESVDLGYLEDHLLVVLDCSNISQRVKEDLFMGARDRVSGKDVKNIIELELEKILHDHEGLRRLAKKRRYDAISKSIGNNRPLKEILSKLISNTQLLADIFPEGSGIEKEVGFEWLKNDKPYVGMQYPSFFRLAGGQKVVTVSCPINHHAIIKYETDVVNDYFSRSKGRGRLKVTKSEMKKRISLWNGIAKLYLIPPTNASLGDKIELESIVPIKNDAFKAQIRVKITEPREKKKKIKKGGITTPRPEFGREKEELDKGDGFQLDRRIPEPIPVYRDDSNWRKYGFNDLTGLRLIKQEGNFDAFVNMDNVYLNKELKLNKKVEPDLIKNQFSTGLILNCISIYYMLQNRKKKNGFEEDNGNNAEYNEKEILDRVNEASDGIALAIIPTINYLGDITKKVRTVYQKA
jgi:hypothetical protein